MLTAGKILMPELALDLHAWRMQHQSAFARNFGLVITSQRLSFPCVENTVSASWGKNLTKHGNLESRETKWPLMCVVAVSTICRHSFVRHTAPPHSSLFQFHMFV